MKLSKPKYIFVTGGVASSLGKGIISASIARLLQARGYSVTIQKLDPYINVDPGTDLINSPLSSTDLNTRNARAAFKTQDSCR